MVREISVSDLGDDVQFNDHSVDGLWTTSEAQLTKQRRKRKRIHRRATLARAAIQQEEPQVMPCTVKPERSLE